MPIIPTIFTLINTILGFISILYSVKFALYYDLVKIVFLQKAAWLIMVAILFDAFDGEAARLLHQRTKFGAELDSLSDSISFGIAPAVLIFVWAHISFKEMGFPIIYSRLIYVVLTIFVLAVVIRLSRFSIESGSHDDYSKRFKGLPSPAGGGFLASLVILQIGFIKSDSFVYQIFGRLLTHTHIESLNLFIYWILPLIIMVLAFLMVSNIPYPHALKTILGDKPKLQYFLYVFTVFGIMWLIRELSFFVFFIAYIVGGPFFALFRKL